MGSGWSRICKVQEGKDEAGQGFYGLRLKGNARGPGEQEGQDPLVYPPQAGAGGRMAGVAVAQFAVDCEVARAAVPAAQAMAASSSSYGKLFTSALTKCSAMCGATVASLLSAANAILLTSR